MALAIGLCAAFPCVSHAQGVPSGDDGQAQGVPSGDGGAAGIPGGDSGPNAIEAVAYVTYGFGDGATFTFPDGTVSQVSEVGRTITSNDPYGWEIHSPDGIGSNVISLRKQDDCRYEIIIATYNTDRKLWTNDKPSIIKYGLDFTGAQGVRIVSGRAKIDGVICTAVENGENFCKAVDTDGIVNTGTQERADEVFRQFRTSICVKH